MDSLGGSRRGLLRTGSLLAAAGLAALAPAHVANARTRTSAGADGSSETVETFSGRSPVGIHRWEYVPFDVGPGARRISVTAWYAEFAAPGITSQVLDLGLFDADGWDVGTADGFRGWSGGARREFTVSATDATPGYLAGALEPGTWAVALGPVVLNPLGMRWELTVTVEYAEPGPSFVPEPAPVRIDGTGHGWYRGDLHVHSVHSDGTRRPEEVVVAARESRVDFFASTEHNTSSANHIWGRHTGDDLLVLAGEEVTTRHGHWLALGIPYEMWVDWRYGPVDRGAFAGFAAAVREAGGLVAAAHPTIPVPGTAWEFGTAHLDAMEVWNGPWNAFDEAAVGLWHTTLLTGRRITALGNSDSHRPEQPIGRPQTVVEAAELSVPALVDAMRAGRAYLAESSDVTLEVTATSGAASAGIGGELPVARGAEVTLTATVTGAPESTLVVHSALGPGGKAHTSGDGTGTLTWRGRGRAARFLRVEVRARAWARMVSLSNPIWLTEPH
ncbi:hypothetical protein BJF85_19430 [Saccharomonospora sp. CUA-673]|nr:hypothetical protein BJF85_19430 [Saccharomonospora sp. CUA-673]